MTDLPTLRPGTARFLLVVLLAWWSFAACAGASTTASPAGSATGGETSPVGGPDPGPATPTACLVLGPEDCARVRTIALAALAGDERTIRYVQVGPFGCADGDTCPTTLAARPEGDVTVEFDGGEAVAVHLQVEPDGSSQVSIDEPIGVVIDPTSAPGLAIGPSPFTLGHCGIFSGIDVDAAWWDPVGPVPMDSGDAVNAVSGVLTAVDRGHATFTTSTGFAVQLQRREGPKFLPLCD